MKKDFVKHTLSNGITVYLYRDKSLKRMVASYNVNYGSDGYFDEFIYDGVKRSVPHAMAHFLEHTLIEKSSLGNMLLHFKNINYDSNGLTYLEITSYYFVGIKNPLENLKKLIYMIDKPAFTKEDVEDVKHAILEEVVKNDNEPYKVGFGMNKRNLIASYDAIPSSYNGLGTIDSTKSITYEDVKLCYDAFYNDQNKFLCIGGNFEIDEMITYLEDIYKDIKPHPNKLELMDYNKDEKVRKEYDEIVLPISQNFCIVSFKMKNIFEESKLFLDLCLRIFFKLKFGNETKFVSDLIQNGITLGGIGGSVKFYREDIIFTLSADVVDCERFVQAVCEEFKNPYIDEKLFELIKKAFKVSELNKLDYIYRAILNFPVGITFSEKLYAMDILDKCEARDLQRIVSKLDFSNKSVTLLKKKEN